MRGKGKGTREREKRCVSQRDKGLPQDRQMAAYNGKGGRARVRMRCFIFNWAY